MRTVLGIVIIVAVLVAVAALLLRRRGRDEIHSIDHYRHALETLQDMRGPAGSSIRILSEDEVAELRKPTPMPAFRSPITESLPPRIPPPPEGHEGMVFDEPGRQIENPRELPIDEQHRGHLHHDDPAWAITRMQNRHPVQNREVKAIVAAVAALLVLIIVGVIIGRSGGSSKHSTSTTTTSSHSVTTTTHRSATTTTAAPTAYTPTPSSTATAATYLVAGASYDVTVTASNGDCWTTATSVSGSQLFAGSIPQGSSQLIQGTAGLAVSLGAPGNVTVKVNGVPVTFPSPFGAPLVLTFQSPPSANTTTTSPVPGTTTTTLPATSTTKQP